MLGIYLVIYFFADNFILYYYCDKFSSFWSFPKWCDTLSKAASVSDAGDCAYCLELQTMDEAFHET